MFESLNEQIELAKEKTSGRGLLTRYAITVVVCAIVFSVVLMSIMLLEY
jgi:hypothetical protein